MIRSFKYSIVIWLKNLCYNDRIQTYIVILQLLGVELNLTVAGVVFKSIYFCQNWELGPHVLELGT